MLVEVVVAEVVVVEVVVEETVCANTGLEVKPPRLTKARPSPITRTTSAIAEPRFIERPAPNSRL